MGIALDGNKMAIATKNEVIVTRNSTELARSYPKNINTYDAFFMPTATYYTGSVDIHDLHYVKNKLFCVNTSFSSICIINDDFSFTPYWQPSFITKLESEDRCHLNGLAVDNDQLKYASAFGTGNTAQSWRKNITKSGVIIDVDSNEIVAQGLAMPHSPRIFDGKLYVLLSADQKLVQIDLSNGKTIDVTHIPGFVRGMAKIGHYVFVATSKLRKESSTFEELQIDANADSATVTAIHLPSGTIAAKLTYLSSIDEIYDLQILPNSIRPNIANTISETHHQGLITPQASFWTK
jgi:uncharacterized protein (TIGR03032 family)